MQFNEVGYYFPAADNEPGGLVAADATSPAGVVIFNF